VVNGGGAGCIDQGELADVVDGLDGIAALPRQSGGGRGDHGVGSTAGITQTRGIFEIPPGKLNSGGPQLFEASGVGSFADECPHHRPALAEPQTSIGSE
jgi:hypothetical protein